MRRTDQDQEHASFKAWLTAAEIHAEQLPDIGLSEWTATAFMTDARVHSPRFLCRKRTGAPAKADLIASLEIHYTRLPLDVMVTYEARHRPSVQAATGTRDRRFARLGKSVLAQAHGGLLRAFIIQRIVAEPKLPIVGVRDRCIERFGLEVVVLPQGVPALVPMPPLRTFQDFICGLRQQGFADVEP